MAERTAKTERLEGDRHAREELVLHVQGPAEKEREVGGSGVPGSCDTVLHALLFKGATTSGVPEAAGNERNVGDA